MVLLEAAIIVGGVIFLKHHKERKAERATQTQTESYYPTQEPPRLRNPFSRKQKDEPPYISSPHPNQRGMSQRDEYPPPPAYSSHYAGGAQTPPHARQQQPQQYHQGYGNERQDYYGPGTSFAGSPVEGRNGMMSPQATGVTGDQKRRNDQQYYREI